MHKPARYPGTRQVLPAGHQVDLVGAALHASPGILDCEGTIAQDRAVGVGELFVGCVIIHAVADLAVEKVLTRVVDDAVRGQTPGIVVNDRNAHLLSGAATERIRGEHVRAVLVLLATCDYHLGNIALELHMRQHAEHLSSIMEVLLDLQLPWPDAPLVVAIREVDLPGLDHVGAPPDVEGTKLCLELRRLICARNPAIAADLIIAVKAHDVAVPVLQVRDGGLEAMIARADDADRVRPDMRLGREAPDAFD
mmetsp:Transcript_9036/g.25229  ORF Transcript_9036/g.25229 Transcript_9036/m.25229 type:complete len:252 (+) Transcript_9036:1116-1871(+)